MPAYMHKLSLFSDLGILLFRNDAFLLLVHGGLRIGIPKRPDSRRNHSPRLSTVVSLGENQRSCVTAKT